jgi:hypothetical protein
MTVGGKGRGRGGDKEEGRILEKRMNKSIDIGVKALTLRK